MTRAPTKRSSSQDTPSPEHSFEVAEPRIPGTYEPSHVIQLLVSIQKDLSNNTAKTERLISDLEKLDVKVSNLNNMFARIQGGVFVGVVLIPIFGGLIWWAIGDRLNDVRELLLSKPVAEHALRPPEEPAAKPAIQPPKR
jgi:hypothetical protein